jgi:hypothetical protein
MLSPVLLYTIRRFVEEDKAVNTVSKDTVSAENDTLADGFEVNDSSSHDENATVQHRAAISIVYLKI